MDGRKAIISVNGQQIGGITIGGSGAACFSNSENLFSSTQLENMNLKDGINNANLLVDDLGVTVPFSIFLFDGSSKLIESNTLSLPASRRRSSTDMLRGLGSTDLSRRAADEE